MDFSKYGYKHAANCESCEYYEYDDITDSYSCSLSLDEDEMVSFLGSNTSACHYYKFYDEYKSVHKQI